jgi:uncharacterized protein YjbI with pentapeptide repeats
LIQGGPDIVREDSGHRRRERQRPIIELTSADLSGMVLGDDADLSYVMLGEANLRGAYLRGADLSNAVLFDTDLTDADLRWADLSDTRGDPTRSN